MGNHEPLLVEETTMGEWARCLALATMLVVVACGNADHREAHATPTAASSSATAVVGVLPPPASAESGPVSTRPVDDAVCRRGQEAVVEDLARRLEQAGARAVPLTLPRQLRAARARLQEACGLVPLRARLFLVAGLRATRRPMQDATYRRTVLALGRWAEQATGRPLHPSRVMRRGTGPS